MQINEVKGLYYFTISACGPSSTTLPGNVSSLHEESYIISELS